MKKAMTAALATMAFVSGAAFADAGMDLAKAKECMSCHSVDKTALAPSFQSIAKKYKGKKDAEVALVKQIKSGSPDSGGYHWGTMKMPSPGARVAVSDAEAHQLLDWVLSQK